MLTIPMRASAIATSLWGRTRANKGTERGGEKGTGSGGKAKSKEDFATLFSRARNLQR
jgi:hypothetical protein